MVHYKSNSDSLAIDGGSDARATIEAQANRLVAEGAIMTLPGCPVTRFLVGHFVWLQEGRAFWFTAYGDSLNDAHLLEFDDTRPVDPAGLCFSRNGRIIGQLTCIEQTGVDDPDDYRIAWKLWQEVAPLRAGMIEGCAARLAGDAWRTPRVPTNGRMV